MLTYALAVLAACANAVSSVLQRKANKRARRMPGPVGTAAFTREGPQGKVRSAGRLVRAAVLAVAAGSTFGLTAALMKAMTGTLSGGIGDLVTSWPVYAMVAAGVLGMFLTQAAMNAGPLIAAQPGLTLSDPLISVLWGVLVFHEQVRQGWYVIGEVFAAAVIVAGVIMLARSPLLSDSPGEGRPTHGLRREGQVSNESRG